MATGQCTLTAERLREVLDYDPETGVFRWRVGGTGRRIGAEAGCRHKAYTRITIDGRRWFAHNLAWLYVYGELPALRLDHRDGDGTNNRIGNLRPATHAQNMRNTKAKRGTSSLFKGVSRHLSGRWVAQICVGGKQTHLGLYADETEAARVYDRAATAAFGEFARTNFPREAG